MAEHENVVPVEALKALREAADRAGAVADRTLAGALRYGRFDG